MDAVSPEMDEHDVRSSNDDTGQQDKIKKYSFVEKIEMRILGYEE
jgi:hypothetical protein